MTRILDDLFTLSAPFSLLAPTPNARAGAGPEEAEWANKSVPNPKHFKSDVAEQMLELVGMLIGLSIRAKLCLAFEFPSLVWKKL